MKSNSDILNEMYLYLIAKQHIKSQKDLADAIEGNETSISQALRGDERYATLNLIKRINKAFGNVFNTDYVCNKIGTLINENITPVKHDNSLPMIPFDAVAGYNGLDHDGIVLSKCVQYSIPDFSEKGAEFVIRVSGNSMYPKYSNGDILACKKVHEILFFQWGKDYVIDSSQGTMIKRIYEALEQPEYIRCYSDNKDFYPEFVMPKSDIRSLSIVVGLIRTE